MVSLRFRNLHVLGIEIQLAWQMLWSLSHLSGPVLLSKNAKGSMCSSVGECLLSSQ